jgi:hypothetical protein
MRILKKTVSMAVILIFVLSLFLGAVAPALADWEPYTGGTGEITLQPDGTAGKDAWVYELFSANNYGTDLLLVAGNRDGNPAYTERSYMEFDLSTIPCGTRIDSATLSLHQTSKQPPYGGTNPPPDPPHPWDYDFALYRVTSSWLESSITWSLQPTLDSVPYGQQTITVDDGVEWRDFDITSLVSGWHQENWDNYGMVLKLVDETDLAQLNFHSSDFTTDPTFRPKLTINYTESNYKMNCPQLPDLDPATGMDISSRAVAPAMPLADNFVCMESGFITDIHVWGSWLDDQINEDASFTVYINDDLAGAPYPGQNVLWSHTFGPGDYTVRKYADTPGEVFWDPLIPPYSTYGSGNDTEVYQYNFYIDPAEAFEQEADTTYWLSVVADVATWGWKTARIEDYQQPDAVYWDWLETGTWQHLVYPAGHPYWNAEFPPSIDLAFVITNSTDLFDFGDAPDPTYPTLLASDGARHVINDQLLLLGTAIDHESDGQQNPDATGDDLVGDTPNDEDGVTSMSPLIPGQQTTYDLTYMAPPTGEPAFVDAWVDFDRSGSWEDDEQILTNYSVVGSGTTGLSFDVPSLPESEFGTTFARFRISQSGGLEPTGLGGIGEVEDYEVDIVADFGDAPDSYTTLLTNGAYHVGDGTLRLGPDIDYEIDGQPTDQDDVLGATPDDEDGVTFPSLLVKGRTATINVFTSGPGYLNAWLDANGNGNWLDAGEQIFDDMQLIEAGPHNYELNFTVPCPEDPPLPVFPSYMRFRLNSTGDLEYYGPAEDGEVEDHMVDIYTADYGDAPEPYPTADAYHIVNDQIYIGNTIDPECQAMPNDTATGDDNYYSDDEDGVIFTSPIVVCEQADVKVTASVPGYLNAWIDYNDDGDWDDTGEWVFVDQALVAGENYLSFTVPCDAKPRNTFARFRFESSNENNLHVIVLDANAAQVQGYNGEAHNGEIEDYQISIRERAEEQEPSTVVGGDIFTVNKMGLIGPWFALAVIIIAGGIFLYRRRVHSMK